MPQFEYAGMQNGKAVAGLIIATDQADAGKKLKAQKINPTKLNVTSGDTGEDPEPATFLGMQVHSDKLKDIDVNETLIDKCSICMTSIDKGDKMLDIECKHSFHKDCLLEYLKKYNHICPICRSEIGNEKINY